MKPAEIAFFALAFLLPLVGGGGVLYYLYRSGSRGDEGKRGGPEPPEPPKKE